MKHSSIENSAILRSIRDGELESVRQIASDCMATVQMNASGIDRTKKWTLGWSLWDEHRMLQYLEMGNRTMKVMTVGREGVVGYLFYTLGADSVSIDQLAVDPTYWRNGYATRMLNALKREMREKEMGAIKALVADRNLGAQLLFRENGFRWRRTLTAIPDMTEWFQMVWEKPATASGF